MAHENIQANADAIVEIIQSGVKSSSEGKGIKEKKILGEWTKMNLAPEGVAVTGWVIKGQELPIYIDGQSNLDFLNSSNTLKGY